MKLLLRTMIIVFILSLTSGCSDSKEVDSQIYALALGADKGMNNKIRITVQFPSYKQGGSDGSKGSEGGNTVISTVEAPTILEGIKILGTNSTRRISLLHLKAIIFSEAFAREGIGSTLQPIARFRETRRIMQVIVCRGTAEDYIKENKTAIGQSLSKAMDLKITQSYDTGYFPRAYFYDFYKSALSPYSQPYAIYAGVNKNKNLKPIQENKKSPLITQPKLIPGEIPKMGNVNNEFAGTAVFDGDKMIGSLDTNETKYFLMVIGQFKRGFLSINDKKAPGNTIVLDIRPGRVPKMNAYFDGNTPIINVKLNIEADIISIQSGYPYEKANKIEELNKQIKETIQDGIVGVIEKSQNELASDFFGFGYKVAHNFTTIQEFEKYNWKQHYPDAVVKVEVETNIRRTGLMMGSSPIIYNDSHINSME